MNVHRPARSYWESVTFGECDRLSDLAHADPDTLSFDEMEELGRDGTGRFQ